VLTVEFVVMLTSEIHENWCTTKWKDFTNRI